MAARFWERNRAKLKPWYLAQRRDSDIIISASPEFLLEPLVCGYLGARLIASRLNPLTGKFDGRNCYGEEKSARLRALYPDAVIDDFYSDSLSDAPLVEKAERGFMVKENRIIPWREYKMPFFEKIKRTYFTKEFILFVFCGGMGTLTNFIISLFLSQTINPTAAYVFGYAISLFTAYALNAKLLFKSALGAGQFLKFAVSYIPNFIILFLFVAVFLNILRWNKVLVYGLAGLLGLPLTFILVKLMVFTKPNRKIFTE
jgi:putative flippase GtrA